MRHYKRWCEARGDQPLRPLDPLTTTLATKKREILRIAKFALFLVQIQGVAAKTASQYVSIVNAWHERRVFVKLAAAAPLSFSHQMLKGWARTHPPPRGVFQRIGITPQHLARGMDLVLGKRGECSPLNQNLRALCSVAFAGLLRGCEACLQSNKPREFQAIPSRKDSWKNEEGTRIILIREAKRTSFAGVAPVVSTPIQFFPGGKIIDAVSEVEEMLAIDPASNSDAPMFRHSPSDEPFSVDQLREVIKQIAAAAGLDPGFFGAHSLR